MQIVHEPNPSPKEDAILIQGINEYGLEQKGITPISFFTYFLKDAQQTIRGGVKGALLHGCLHVDSLWIDPALRHQKWGTKLMREAENFGKMHQAHFVTVNTMDWEALPFYQKLGYQIEFVREGFEKESKMYFLRKNKII